MAVSPAPDPPKKVHLRKDGTPIQYKPGPGRPAGHANVVPMAQRRSIESLARTYTALAIMTLADVCRNGDTSSSRVAAAIALLDRGYGKAPLTPASDSAQPIIIQISEDDARL